MDAVAKKSGCEVAGLWRKSIVNHVYYVAATAQGDEDLLEAMWTSLGNHIQNVHEHDSDLYEMCGHPPLIEEDRTKEWLVPGEQRKIISACGRPVTIPGNIKWKCKLEKLKIQ